MKNKITNEENMGKNIPDFHHYQDIVDRAHSEINWVRTAYKWLISIVGIVILVGLYFSYKSASDFKSEIRKETEDVKNKLTKEVTELESRMKSDLDKQFLELQNQVESRIDEEFKKENIHKLVQDKAKERIDKMATPLIKKELNENFLPKLTSAELNLKKMEIELNKNIKSVNLITEFTMTVLAAQNDDRKSFDKLAEWSNDKLFPFSDMAKSVWIKILDDHAQPFFSSGFKIPWAENIDPSKLSFTDLEKMYKSAPQYLRLPLLEYIWTRKDISKKERMAFLVNVLKNENSLKVVEYAGRFFNEASGLKYKPLAVNEFLKWWGKNKENIK